MSLGRSAAIAVLLVVGALGGVSCTTSESVKPSNGGGDASAIQRSCQAYCQHLRTLGCKEGAPLQSGTSCETFCIDTQTAGHDLRMSCVLKIKSCAEIQSCNK
jgi:hypothetical protein